MITDHRDKGTQTDLGYTRQHLVSGVWAVLLSTVFAVLLYGILVQSFRFSGYGEGLYDLHYIAGGWLDAGWPTPELWRPGASVTHYYNFGLAGWGEVGAVLGLSLAATYVLGLVVFPSLVFAATFLMAGGAVWLRAVVALIATFPASGISLWLGLGYIELPEHLQNMGHVRLVEWADRAGDSAIGQALVTGQAYPLESLAHLVFELQDLHPPVMGFALLSGALMVFLGRAGTPVLAPASVKAVDIRWGFLPGALLVVAYAANAWMVPFLSGLTLCGLVLRGRPWAVMGVVAGAALSYAVLWPVFFRYFEPPNAVSIEWLKPEFRSAWKSWMLVWAPCLVATAWWLFAAVIRKRMGAEIPWAHIFFPLVFLAAVVSLEVVHLDDPYAGSYERFNSVLKTGSLALAGWVTALLVLATRQRKVALWLPIVIVLGVPSFLQLKDLSSRITPDASVLNVARDPTVLIAEEDLRESYRKLRLETSGVTLEFTEQTAYSIVPLVSTLAAFPTWAGWGAHLAQIGAFADDDWQTREILQGWYKHFPPDNTVLDAHNIEYILVRYALNWSDSAINERRESLGHEWEWVAASRDHRGHWAGYFRRRR